MKNVWIIDDAVVTPLGNSGEATFTQIKNGKSGIQRLVSTRISGSPIYAGYISTIHDSVQSTRFENICLKALHQLKSNYTLSSEKTLFILSTTKGNIHLLEDHQANIRD